MLYICSNGIIIREILLEDFIANIAIDLIHYTILSTQSDCNDFIFL